MPRGGLKYGLPGVRAARAAVKRTASQMAAVGNLFARGLGKHRGAPFGNKNAVRGQGAARSREIAENRGTDARASAMAAAQRRGLRQAPLAKNERSSLPSPTIA